MRVRLQTGASGIEVCDDVDADGRSAKARLQNVRGVEPRFFAVLAEWHPRQGGQTRIDHERAESKLVHAERSPHGCRAGVGNSRQVQGTLQCAVFARAAVTADQHGIEIEAVLLRPQPARGLDKPATRAADQA